MILFVSCKINKKAKGRKNNEVKRWHYREICVTLHPIMIPWRLKEETACCLSALRRKPFILNKNVRNRRD